LALSQAPRAFSLQDINPRSRTYGCCDRNFWQYKTITDFPAGIWQQLALPFALLYVTPFEGNRYLDDPEMLDRARSAMLFWRSAQHRNGALDEWYRNEFSYCATSFTTFAVAESLLLLKEHLSKSDRDTCLSGILKAAGWLASRFNPTVMNQNLVACAALWNAYSYTQEDWLRQAFQRKWQETLEHLDEEGWFEEYGGADLGYTTLALDILACLDRRGCEAKVLEVAQEVCKYLASFLCQSGGLAGRLGSRGTEHTFAFGAEAFAGRIPEAAALAAHLRRRFEAGELCTPERVDDRYLAYFYLPQFTLACTVAPSAHVLAKVEGDASWGRSGFRIWRRDAADLVCSLRRQGAFNLHVQGQRTHHNLGYWVETERGERWTSSAWNPAAIEKKESSDGALTVRGQFVRVEDDLPLVKRPVAFHAFSKWILRYPPLGERFQSALRRRKILRRRLVPLGFERTLRWENDALRVTDTIRRQPGCPPLRAVGPVDDVGVHSPSAHTGGASPTQRLTIAQATARGWAARLSRSAALRLEVVYARDGSGRFVAGPVQPCPKE